MVVVFVVCKVSGVVFTWCLLFVRLLSTADANDFGNSLGEGLLAGGVSDGAAVAAGFILGGGGGGCFTSGGGGGCLTSGGGGGREYPSKVGTSSMGTGATLTLSACCLMNPVWDRPRIATDKMVHTTWLPFVICSMSAHIWLISWFRIYGNVVSLKV